MSVRDHGIGMAPDVLPRLFERFYRVPATAGRAQGMGLGLPITKALVEAHGGTLTVESVRGRGSAFIFTRPEPPADETRNLGFIQVFPLKENGEKGEPTYTNIPKAPLDFLKLIAAPSEWRGSPVTIPGSAFPQPKHTYIIVFQSVKTVASSAGVNPAALKML